MALKQVRNIFILLSVGISLLNPLYAQEKCATDKLPVNKREPIEQFEQWMLKEVNSIRNLYGKSQAFRTNAAVQIPVVVHVIHNGEPVGVGSNISDSQILSQIEVLNEDFRRLNADTVNTPEVFKPFAADVEIEFVLALQDPDGLPTDGIVRVEGAQNSYHPVTDQVLLASQSYWPAEDYLNIWVTTLKSNYLGYAQFPISNLPGLEDQQDNRLTDGVVIHYRTFGSIAKDPDANIQSKFDLGRTTTHEVGHFFGLRHIWGDGNCSMDDFVSDTPVAGNSNSGYGGSCTFPGPNSCNSGGNDLPDMFQNFMDYTDDKCMNIFTLEQKARMHVVLNESPRRASLKTSHGLQQPALFVRDLELRQVVNPRIGVCGETVIPQIAIRNYGEETINSAVIELYVNNILLEEHLFTNLNLESYESDTITFDSHEIPDNELNFLFQIVEVNGQADNINGNALAITVPALEVLTLPVVEDFEDPNLERWQIINPDEGYTWSLKNAPFYTSSNNAIGTSFSEDERNGAQDYLISDPFYLPEDAPSFLSFDVAYTRYASETLEGLKVVLSTDCGNTYPYTVFEKYGPELETKIPQREDFVPEGPHHWRKEIIDLSSFSGMTVRLSFVAINDYGNNLYLDNISILDEEIVDVELAEIISPTPAQCETIIEPALRIVNNGKANIGSLQLEMTLNGTKDMFTFNLTDSLEHQEEMILDFPEQKALEGLNSISFNLVDINEDNTDHFSYNNFLSREFLISDTRAIVPLRENFDDFKNSSWHILNLDSELTWQLEDDTNNNKLASFPSSQYHNQKDTDWIISPVLDFTDIYEAAIFFDLSYSGSSAERLQLLYSTDCGASYHPLGYDRQGSELSTYSHTKKFIRQYVSLEKVIGHDDVILAFVASSGQGNDIEIDNIEIFLTDDVNPVIPSEKVVVFPNPTEDAANLSFNLETLQNVSVKIVDNLGKERAIHHLPYILNQTYTIDISQQPDGMYYILIQGQTFQSTLRLIKY